MADTLGTYTFQVEIDDIPPSQCKEVSGLEIEHQVIDYDSSLPGGKEDRKKIRGPRKWGDITIKRGATGDRSWSDWYKLAQNGRMSEAKRNGSIVIYSIEEGEMLRYNFVNGWPMKYNPGSFKAGGNEVAMEELVITHEGLELA